MPNQSKMSHHYAKIGDDPSQNAKLETAQKHYIVQKALGRPIKKYNLLISKDDGDWFSSEDDLDGGLIMGVLVKLEKEHPINCGAWTLMYRLASVKAILEGRQFFLYANVSDHRSDGINKFEYFHWSEEVEKKEEVKKKKKKKKATKKELEEENKTMEKKIEELQHKLNEAEDVLQNLEYKWSDEFQGYSCE